MRLQVVITVLAMFVYHPIGVASQTPPDDSVVHGTINIALGNENGLVVLTDSMLTGNEGQLSEPGEKLFKLDDHMVCSFAGFFSAPAASSRTAVPELNTSVSAIIHEYVRQSSPLPPQSIAEVLGALALLINVHLTALANVRDVLGNPLENDGYTVQLIVAGNDLDGQPKIGRTALRTRNRPWGIVSDVQDVAISTIEDTLIWKLNGMPDVAEQILQHPESKPEDAAISLYATSRRENDGRSMTAEQMVELAKRLAYYTSKVHREVGGPHQIAILKKSQNVTIAQPTFPMPKKSLAHFRLSVKSTNQYSDMHTPFADHVPRVPHVFVRCSWIGTKTDIDSHYFIGNNFTDSDLFYDGGPISLGDTNRVTNSALIIGPHAKRDDETVRHLRTAFAWAKIVYATLND